MGDLTGQPTVAERIRRRFERLTRAERQLANALLANYPAAGLASITAFAEVSGVSTPTVVRMSKKLGFAGFPELHAALREELQATVAGPIAKHDRWAGGAPDAHILNRFAEAATENLRQTLAQIAPDEFDAVATLLADPNRSLHIAGGRITRPLADYFFTHMQVIRSRTALLPPAANRWPHHLLDMTAGDVLVVFDIRRYERAVLRLAEMARERDVELVLFTDQWGSPVAKLPGHVFHCRIEAPSAWDSSVVTMFVAEAVIAAVETRLWQSTRDRMGELERLFDRTGLFRKFT